MHSFTTRTVFIVGRDLFTIGIQEREVERCVENPQVIWDKEVFWRLYSLRGVFFEREQAIAEAKRRQQRVLARLEMKRQKIAAWVF